MRPVAALLLAAGAAAAQPAAPPERTNFFDDPFVQVTRHYPNCPVPRGPSVTAAEVRAQSHMRAEKGTTCHLQGRCRLPNAYLYDRDIIARTARFLAFDGRFDASSLWLTGQRRWVVLQGCVPSRAFARSLVRQIELIDDVERVVDETMVGETGRPPYAIRGPS